MNFDKLRFRYARGVIRAYVKGKKTWKWCLGCLKSNFGVSPSEASIVISRIWEELGKRMIREMAERLARLNRELFYAGWEEPKGRVELPSEKFKRKWWTT